MKKLIKKFYKKIGLLTTDDKKEIIKSLKNENRSWQRRCDGLLFRLWSLNDSLNVILYQQYLENSKKTPNFHPKVSIIMPAYNASNYIREAIASALNQTYDNIEIIVVNDGSTDNGKTKKIVKEYKNKVKYYEKENGGVSSALNYGISKMTGDYFSWLSHDDLMEPEHIKHLVEFISIEGNKEKIPYSLYKYVDENKKLYFNLTINAQVTGGDYKISTLKNEFPLLFGEINGGSVLIPKIAFKKVGYFSEDQRITQERDMWDRLMHAGYDFVNIPYDTSVIRLHSSQVSNTNNKVREESQKKNLDILSKISDDSVKKLSGERQYLYETIASYYKSRGNTYMYDEIEKMVDKEVDKNE